MENVPESDLILLPEEPTNLVVDWKAHFEILSGLYGINYELDMTWNSRHISWYHGDDAHADLERWVLLNIEWDYRAKCYISDISHDYRRQRYVMSKGGW